MTECSSHNVPARRLAWGIWNHEKGRDEGEGDIHSSYCADTIAIEGKVRKSFTFAGNLWVVVELEGHACVERAEAYRLLPLRMFQGEPTTYKNKTGTEEGASAARDDPMGFYHGMKVRQGKESFVLCGPPVLFVAESEPTRPDERPAEAAQLSLFT